MKNFQKVSENLNIATKKQTEEKTTKKIEIMKLGDKVKHINTGEHIYTIIELNENIATIKRPPELWKKLTPNSKRSIIIDVSICKIENLIIINDESAFV